MRCALLQSRTAFCRAPKQFKQCGSPNLCRNKHCCCRIGLLFLRLEWGLLLCIQLLLHPAHRVAKSFHIGRAEFRNNGIRFPKGYTFSGACAYSALKEKYSSRVNPPDSILVSIHTDLSFACRFSIIEGDTKTTSSHAIGTVRQV